MTTEALVRRARDAVERGDLDAARAALLDLPEPRPVPATLLIAEIELARADPESLSNARTRLEAALRSAVDPEDAAWGRVLLGAALSCLGLDAEARPHFEKGLMFEPAWARGEYGAAYAATLIELAAWTEARAAIDALEAVDVAERTLRCRWHRRQGDAARGLALLEAEQGPAWDAGIAYEAACAFKAMGNDEEAAAWCARSRALRPVWFDRAVEMEPAHLRPC